MNSSLIFPAMLVAIVVTVSLMLALRPVAKSVGLIDHPGGRKHHTGVIPLIGGIAIFFGVIAGVLIIGETNLATGSLVFAAALLIGIGVLDDIYTVRPIVRVLAQISTILLLYYGANLSLAGIGNPFGLGEIMLGPVALIGTVVVGITVINAYNFVDGIDGLAGTIVIITLAALAISSGAGTATSIALVTIASVLGFLIFNFPSVHNRQIRAFMGDAGSTFLGFLIVGVSLSVTQGESRAISPVAVLWFASIPLYDLFTCFVARIRAGKSPFTPGRDHFHHWLRRGGFNGIEKLVILGGLQALYASVALIGHFSGTPDFVLFFGWSALGLTQYKVIRTISTRHRFYLQRQLKEGKLSPARARRTRALQ